jgi:hypothetical protein
MIDYYIAYSIIALSLELPHKNIEKLPNRRVFNDKKDKNRSIWEKNRIFLAIFFAETVVILIFAQTKQQLFYSHN